MERSIGLNKTGGVSDNKRLEMIGNGWTVDVIKHIFKGIENIDVKKILKQKPLKIAI